MTIQFLNCPHRLKSVLGSISLFLSSACSIGVPVCMFRLLFRQKSVSHNRESKYTLDRSTRNLNGTVHLESLFPSKRCSIWNACRKWRTSTTTALSGRATCDHKHRQAYLYIIKYKLNETQRETSTQNKMDLERSATYETYSWFDEYITQNTFFSRCVLCWWLYIQNNKTKSLPFSLTLALNYAFSFIWCNE